MTEHEALEAIQDAWTAAKKDLRAANDALRVMIEINKAAGRNREANAAMGVRARTQGLLADINLMHSDATELLFIHWPDHAEPIVTRSGHR